MPRTQVKIQSQQVTKDRSVMMLTIPKYVIEKLKWKIGDRLDADIENDKLVYRKMRQPNKK